MGCDIHSFAEKKTQQGWEFIDLAPFDRRSYGMYGFLAGVPTIPMSPQLPSGEDCRKTRAMG